MASKVLLPPLASISKNSTLVKHRLSRQIVLLYPNPIFHHSMHTIKRFKTRNTPTILVHCCLRPEQEHEASNKRRDDSRITRLQSKLARKEGERHGYLVAALVFSLGVASMAIFSIYCRFASRIMNGELPCLEMTLTFAVILGACVGMEYWARWAHRVLWHGSLWSMHKSHHKAREGMFELNDAFAIGNAIPAICLLSYGVCNDGLLPYFCFATGLGITVFGIAYMFIHDGLVHRRFPVGPIANFPYLQRLAVAHQLHHSEKLKGVPYGLFLAPQEIEDVGGQSELQEEINKRYQNVSK